MLPSPPLPRLCDASPPRQPPAPQFSPATPPLPRQPRAPQFPFRPNHPRLAFCILTSLDSVGDECPCAQRQNVDGLTPAAAHHLRKPPCFLLPRLRRVSRFKFICWPQLAQSMQNCKRVFQVSDLVMLIISHTGNLQALHFCIADGRMGCKLRP